MSEAAEQKALRLIVRNLSFRCDEAALRKAFEKHGTVVDTRVPMKPDGKHPGFGFVQMSMRAECDVAMEKLNEQKIVGRMVAVDYALSKHEYEKQSAAAGSAPEASEDKGDDAASTVSADDKEHGADVCDEGEDEDDEEAADEKEGEDNEDSDNEDDDDEDEDEEKRRGMRRMTQNQKRRARPRPTPPGLKLPSRAGDELSSCALPLQATANTSRRSPRILLRMRPSCATQPPSSPKVRRLLALRRSATARRRSRRLVGRGVATAWPCSVRR